MTRPVLAKFTGATPAERVAIEGQFAPHVFRSPDPGVEDLPCRTNGSMVITEWELTMEERLAVLGGANVQVWLQTFGAPLSPISVCVDGVDVS